VKNEIHVVSIGQSTNQDFVKKSGLQRIFFIFFFLNRDAFHLKFLILSTNSLVTKKIRTPILNDHRDTICTKHLPIHW